MRKLLPGGDQSKSKEHKKDDIQLLPRPGVATATATTGSTGPGFNHPSNVLMDYISVEPEQYYIVWDRSKTVCVHLYPTVGPKRIVSCHWATDISTLRREAGFSETTAIYPLIGKRSSEISIP